jgi:hypothetical protein
VSSIAPFDGSEHVCVPTNVFDNPTCQGWVRPVANSKSAV